MDAQLVCGRGCVPFSNRNSYTAIAYRQDRMERSKIEAMILKRAILIFAVLCIFPFDQLTAQTTPFKSTVERLLDHSSDVESVAFSPDGSILASSAKNIIYIWEVATGQLLIKLVEHRSTVHSLSFNPDGSLLASGSADKTIIIWQTINGRLLKTLRGHSGGVNSVSFSPDGNYLASGSGDKTIKIWQVDNYRLIWTLKKHQESVLSVAFSNPNGLQLVSGSGDNTVRIWRLSDGQLLRTLRGHESWVNSVVYSPDGKYIASGSIDNIVKVWEVSNRSLLRNFEHHSPINSVIFTPDSRYLATTCQDKIVTIWDLFNGDKVESISAHRSSVSSVDFTLDGLYMATGGYDRKAKLWRIDGVEPRFGTGTDSSNFGDLSGTIEADNVPPIIIIIEPMVTGFTDIHVSSKYITVSGKVTDDSGIHELLVNGQSSQIGLDGNFSIEMKLVLGENQINCKAIDTKDNMSELVFNVMRDTSSYETNHDQIDRQGTDYALLIGIEDYKELPKLVNPVSDVQTVGEELGNSYGFKVEYLLNPDKEEILLKVKDYARRGYKSGDQLFIMYAGHGEYDQIIKSGYISTKNSRSIDSTNSSRISHAEFRQWIDAIPCEHILLVMDACYSGTFDLGINGGNTEDLFKLAKDSDETRSSYVKRKMQPKTRRYITSGGKEYVLDGRPGHHSPFTNLFLKALGSYGGADGILTLGELHQQLSELKPVPRAGTFGRNEVRSDFLFIEKK